jgi:isopentenyl-diphosphate delta-isomerase
MVPEQVVLVDDAGQPVGVADKATVHGPSTPRHLAFSCYGFDGAGRVLVTQRAAEKRAFPLVWTGSCCGHPAPGEDPAAAVHRRVRSELGTAVRDLRLVLPDFSYRAADSSGSRSTSCARCSSARSTASLRPDPAEVAAWEWWPWDRFLDEAARGRCRRGRAAGSAAGGGRRPPDGPRGLSRSAHAAAPSAPNRAKGVSRRHRTAT